MPSDREWLKDAERITSANLRWRKGRVRRKRRLMDALQIAEDAKAKRAETTARRQREKNDLLKPPPLEGEE